MTGEKKNALRDRFLAAGKALLLLASLNVVLAMALGACALNGKIALRLPLLLGVFLSADLLALLIFVKLHLAPESPVGISRFATMRNCSLLFLILGLVSGGFYYHAALFPEQSFDFFGDLPALLPSGIAPQRILPERASDIHLFENQIPPRSLEWRCRLAPDDFRAFAMKKNWSPEELAGRNPRELFARYLPETVSVSPDALFFQSSFAGGRLFILYDGTTQTMYGRIAGR